MFALWKPCAPANVAGHRMLFTAIRSIIQEIRGFGDEEAANLKQKLEHHKEELEQFKAMREQRRVHEEKIALLQLRRAVGSLQDMDRIIKQQEITLGAAADNIERQMKSVMENDMQQRAVDLLQSIDYSKVLMGQGAEPDADALADKILGQESRETQTGDETPHKR